LRVILMWCISTRWLTNAGKRKTNSFVSRPF
jgi:hypothetical protein